MNRSILIALVALSFNFATMAQTTETHAQGAGNNQTSATANTPGKAIELQSGTQLAAELQKTLDVRKANVGDEVILKTTKAIKSEGQTVVDKGARLIGHITQVEQKTKSNDESRIGILFDRLEKGALSVPISTTIGSITGGRAVARTGDDAMFESGAGSNTATQTTTSGAGAQGNGGLVGGVTNTAGGVLGGAGSVVGGVADTTTTAVGSTVNATTGAAGGTATGMTRSLSRIHIADSTSASAEGGSTLSVRGDNLRLEKGTQFNLVLNQSASTRASNEP